MNLPIQRPNEAYVKNIETNEFILDNSTGKHLRVSIEKAVRIKVDNDKLHKMRTYWSLHPDEKRRYRLKVHSVNMQFEKFNRGDNNFEFDRNYDESMSHKCAVEALSRLSCMTLIHVENNKRIPITFEFDTVRKEPYLHLPNNTKYFPDILCTFNEEHDLYDKWGGKIALEVTYTHGCESYKQEDFMFHNIPVFEVTIENDSARQFPAERPNWPKGKVWGEKLVEEHINNLVNWFSQNIVGELKVDPISTRLHLQNVKGYIDQIESLEISNKKLHDLTQRAERSLASNFSKINKLENECSNSIEVIKSYEEKYSNLIKKNSRLTDLVAIEKENNNILQVTAKEMEKSNETLNASIRGKHLVYKIALWCCSLFILFFIFSPTLFPEIAAKSLNSWFKMMVNLRNL